MICLGDEAEMPLSPELVAALEEEQLHPMREIWRYLVRDGRLLLVTVIIALGFMAAAGIVEMAQLRGLLDLGNTLGPEQLNSVLLLFFILPSSCWPCKCLWRQQH